MRSATALPGAPSMGLIAVLALLNAVTPFAIDMYLSAFPQMAVDLDTPATSVQLTLTTFLIGLAVGQLVIGSLSDRYGRRKPLVVGTMACLVASILCAFAPTVEILIGLRFVQGVGGAAGVVIARAVIADRARGSQAARLFAVMMLIGVLAPLTAPIIGGAIVTSLGWRAVFGALALLCLLMLLGVLFAVKESLPAELRRPGGIKALASSTRSVLTNRFYIGYTLTMAFTSAAMFGYISASPFVLQNIMGLSPGHYSLTFGACSLAVGAGTAVAARLVESRTPRRVLMGGVAAMVVVSALLLVTVTIGGVPHWPTVALMACFMGCMGFIYSNAAMLATTEVRHAAGTGSAVLGFLQYGTGALAAPLVGLAGQHSAVPMGWTMFGAALAAAAALFLLTRGHVPVDEAEEAEQALAGSVAAE